MKKKLDSELVRQLRNSKAKVGALLPVLVSSKTGRIIDGSHRIHSDKSWPVVKLDLDERQGLIARLSINALRHPLDPLDFDELGALLVGEGVKHGDVAHEIAKLTGVSYNIVLRNLDSGFLKKTNVHYSKEMKKAYGKRMSAVAANKHMNAEHKPTANVESMTESAIESMTESAIDDPEDKASVAVKEYGAQVVQSYAKSERTPRHSLIEPLSALCDASDWLVRMNAGEMLGIYRGLSQGEKSAVDLKLNYLQANLAKLATAIKGA